MTKLVTDLTPLRGFIVGGECTAAGGHYACSKAVSSSFQAVFLNGKTLELSARSISLQSFIISALSAQ